jgi:hypothetical protein
MRWHWLALQTIENRVRLSERIGQFMIDNNHVVPLAGRSVLFSLTTQF